MKTVNPKKLISYIFPIYNEQDNIELLFRTMQTVTKPLDRRYRIEYIFVNDGSRDNSLQKLYDLTVSNNNVRVIDFSRNFGHQIAVTAGIDAAEGDALIIMDSDMQDPPAVSLELIAKWEEGYDVAYAQRLERKDTVFKKLSASLFYRLLHAIADIDIPRNTGDFRLIDRKVAEEMKRYKEHNRFLRGMVSNIGFKQIAVGFKRDERHAGVTGYPLKKMLKFASDGIFSFSSAPLIMVSRVGYLITMVCLLGIVYALSVRLFEPQVAIAGWAFIVISIFFIGGIQLIMLGVIGNYIGRIYTEVQDRPLYSINAIYSQTMVAERPLRLAPTRSKPTTQPAFPAASTTALSPAQIQ